MTTPIKHPLLQEEKLDSCPWDGGYDPNSVPVAQVQPGVAGLYVLALQGRWQDVAHRCSTLLPPSPSSHHSQSIPSEEMMYVHTMFVMSLVKLRAWNEASEQLDRAIKATVDGSDGPLTPWALRCLQAEIAAGLGREDECINLLYELMSDSRGSNNERRYKETTFVLLAKLVRVGRYKSALSLCNQYLSRFPQDSYAWSQVSRIQMLLGDFPAAQNSIEQQTSRLSSSNKPRGKDPAALLALTNRPAEAMRALETLESETNFANEIAVCQALSGSLSDARRTLESAFRQPPSSVLSLVREAITSNLMTLVGLVPQERDGQEARRRVGAWIAAAAPDDFDLTLASKQSISTL